MGKKSNLRGNATVAANNEEMMEEVELEKERAAVEQIRREREQQQQAGDENGLDVPEKRVSYNRDGLIKCLQDSESRSLPFLETMLVDELPFNIVNELDDLEREMAFYNHALKAANEGRDRLKALNIPTTRPNDFFCEQMKSDTHMARVKERLLVEQKRIEAFEQRKNREQNRKFNKQLVEQKKQEKHSEQKQLLHEIDEIKAGSSSAKGGKGGKDGKRSASSDSRLSRVLEDGPQQSRKRKVMDQKYGFGGRDKKRAKLNDKKSFNDMSEFNPRGGKFVRRGVRVPGKGGKGGKRGCAGNRPGKEARKMARAGRSS
jgi:rRNA-processing protein EBP2